MPQESNHIDAAIADLEAWRDQIATAIDTLRHFGTKGGSIPSSAPPSNGRSVPDGELRPDAFFQMTVPDAAEKYLKLVKVTKEIPEIAEALLSGGLKSSSKNFSDMTRTVMSRDDRFVKVPSGGWGLSEWYPAMRKEKKQKPSHAHPKPAESPAPEPEQTQAQQERGEHGSVDAATKIIKAMSENLIEEWTASKLTAATGLKHKTVQGTIFRLRKEGKIARNVEGLGYRMIHS